MPRTQTVMALVVFVLAASLPSRGGAQGVPAPHADSTLRNSIGRIGAENPRSVRLASRETGRLEGYRVSLVGDSVLLSTNSGVRAIAVGNVDSVWVQRGTAALMVGLITGLPCALYGGLVGAFFGGGPNNNSGRATAGLIVGFLGGGLLCGTVGAGLGSLIRRWRLEYARPHS